MTDVDLSLWEDPCWTTDESERYASFAEKLCDLLHRTCDCRTLRLLHHDDTETHEE